MGLTLVLYDERCRFCRLALAGMLAVDRHRRLEPVGLRSARARDLLGTDDCDVLLAAVRTVTPEGAVISGAEAVAGALRAGGVGALAAPLDAAPQTADRLYGLVAAHRGRLSPLIPHAVSARADALIARRAGA